MNWESCRLYPATPARLADVLASCSGKPGTAEDETVMTRSKGDKFVEIESGVGAEIAKTIRRCGSRVTHVWRGAHTWGLRVDASCFRGFSMAFRPVDVESKPLPPGTFGKAGAA